MSTAKTRIPTFLPIVKPTEIQTQRFYAHLIVDDENRCWGWSGNKTCNGYGRVCVNKKMVLAHRVMWVVHFGEIPAGLEVCHTCDNPPCCNPNHLFIGTHRDNIKDREDKGRNKLPTIHPSISHPEKIRRGDNHHWKLRPELIIKGENHSNAKLTESQVLKIRRLCVEGKLSQREIAAMFGVNQTQVSAIHTRRNWSHI